MGLLLVVVELEGVLGRKALMDDGGDGLHHREGLRALEHVAPHVHTCRAGLDGPVRELERLVFGQLLAAGDDDRHRALRHHCLEALLGVVRLHERGAVFGAHARGEAEVARVARHVLAYGRHAKDGDAELLADVDGVHEVVGGDLLARLVAACHHYGHGASVHAHDVLDVVDAVEVELGEDGGAAIGTEADGLGDGGRDDAAEDAARAHEAVGVLDERVDREVNALESASGAHDEAVVAREHDGAARLRVEDAREAVLHAPSLVLVPLEEERGVRLRLVEAVRRGLLESVHVCHFYLLKLFPFVGR